ncbi:hypothetical protein, partial [Thiolapillus sp.]|uniref:hypothetical protein n=2 Tax=Thiolapillus sp. TaxID=2017437 RepID=UPI003AF59AB9
MAGRSKKELIPILQQFKDISDLDLYVQRMNAMRKEIKHADTAQRRSWLIKVVEGYASLRRDLKLSWEMYRALDLIRLLDKPKELTLSRANDLLQEFSLQEEGQTPDKRVFDLVIDFGTSQSPKSTRPLTTYLCPSRPGHPA